MRIARLVHEIEKLPNFRGGLGCGYLSSLTRVFFFVLKPCGHPFPGGRVVSPDLSFSNLILQSIQVGLCISCQRWL
uniref:Uncharacterized protein n=1 Tax=Physcomitrium patens TaxID=3218 RepID=A0A2K1L0E4_PHYPA|nr:hypothetical protein PHYPA_002287 [Physcomitrium patens]